MLARDLFNRSQGMLCRASLVPSLVQYKIEYGVRISKLILFSQLFDGSVDLQKRRLERQQAIQKSHLKELRDFAEEHSLDPRSLMGAGGKEGGRVADRASLTSDRRRSSAMGMASM